MAANSFSAMLRELVDEIQADLISFDEYRQRRRALLNQIDEEYNSVIQNEGTALGNTIPDNTMSDNTLPDSALSGSASQDDVDEQTNHYNGEQSEPDSMQTIVYSIIDENQEN